MSTFVSPNSLTISVPITLSAGNTLAAYLFPTQQELQDRKIVAIETYCSLDVTGDPNNTGNLVLIPAVFNQAFLTIYRSAMTGQERKANGQVDKLAAGDFYDKIPFSSMRRVQNNYTGTTPSASYAREIFRIRPCYVVFNKTKVEFPNSVTPGATNYSALFTFHYLDEGDPGYEWEMHHKNKPQGTR